MLALMLGKDTMRSRKKKLKTEGKNLRDKVTSAHGKVASEAIKWKIKNQGIDGFLTVGLLSISEDKFRCDKTLTLPNLGTKFPDRSSFYCIIFPSEGNTQFQWNY